MNLPPLFPKATPDTPDPATVAEPNTVASAADPTGEAPQADPRPEMPPELPDEDELIVPEVMAKDSSEAPPPLPLPLPMSTEGHADTQGKQAGGQNETVAQVIKALQELLKNPVVVAGGALIIGVIIARLTGNSSLRNRGTSWVVDLLRERVFGQTPPAAAPPPPPPPPPPPQPSGPDLLRVLTEKLGPHLGDSLKKRLAELLGK